MRPRLILSLSTAFLIFALFLQWLRLPTVQGGLWMSPDETAVATAAATFAENGSFLFPMTLPEAFAWAHPRSWVYLDQEGRLAPVGFLGMPALLSTVYKSFGVMGLDLFTPLLALVTIFALWRVLPTRWPRAAKIATVCVWMTFPTVVLYANRGLFAQLPVVCLAIWTWWGLAPTETPHKVIRDIVPVKFFLAGLAFGLAVAIRPTELPWLVALVVFALLLNLDWHKQIVKKTPWGKRWLAGATFAIPCFSILLFAAWLGHQTYGAWLVSGYQIRPETLNAAAVIATSTVTDSVSIFQTLPFAFHPRNIFWNVMQYFFGILWPWTLALLIAVLIGGKDLVGKNKDFFKRLAEKGLRWSAIKDLFAGKARWGIVALIAAAVWTVLFYGNGLYQDNVRLGEISLGNSFLRYTLPCSVLFAVAVGFVVARAWSHWQLKLLAMCGVAALVSVGLWTSMARDAEGVLANTQEIVRYQEIRAYAKKSFGQDAVMLSDRSDKIFFPAFLAVSPMPEDDQITSLLDSVHAVGMLLTTQDSVGLDEWTNRGFYLFPLQYFGNQTLYEVQKY